MNLPPELWHLFIDIAWKPIITEPCQSPLESCVVVLNREHPFSLTHEFIANMQMWDLRVQQTYSCLTLEEPPRIIIFFPPGFLILPSAQTRDSSISHEISPISKSLSCFFLSSWPSLASLRKWLWDMSRLFAYFLNKDGVLLYSLWQPQICCVVQHGLKLIVILLFSIPSAGITDVSHDAQRKGTRRCPVHRLAAPVGRGHS